MRKFLALVAVSLTLSLFACLTAPNEPGTAGQMLTCGPNESLFNGTCSARCAKTVDCGHGLTCMEVGGAQALCLDYAHCAYLASDTTCGAVPGALGSYDPYWMPYSYPGTSMYSGYTASGCLGDAKWQTEAPASDPACGQKHMVLRCRSTPTGCGLVPGTTLDVADK